MGSKTGFGACSRVTVMKVLLLMAIYLSGLTLADQSEEEMTGSQEIDEDEEDDDRHLRLPDVVTPNHYQITLLPILDKDPRLCGHVWITVTVEFPTKAIILNAFQLIPVEVVVQAESVALNNTDTKRKVEDTCFYGGDDDDDEDYFSDEDEDENHVRKRKKIRNDMVEDLHLDDDDQQLVVILKDVLQVGDVYRVGILYHAEIYDGENIGFFRLENKLNKNDCCEKWIGATQLEATHARKVFPCLDEPAFKATFELTVGHTSRLTAISNMPKNSSTSLETMEDWVWDTFQTTPNMSTYLLACILSQLEYLESSYRSIDGRNITIKLWSDKEKFNQLKMPIRLIPEIMEVLENYLNVPYSLPKLDMVAIGGYDAARAMENWGLIVQSEATLLVSDDTMERTLMALTLVHELAHQWFGNLVTSRWWDDIWLNEGLSTLFENIILKQLAPDLTPDVLIALFFQQSFYHDKVATSLPLNYPAELLPSYEHKFDGFTYAKASAMFRMVRNFIGEEGFRTGLKRYFVQYQFKAANSTDLWVLLNQEARRTHTINSRMNIARIMKTWTTQPGYPLVTVERNPDGTFQLSQAVFVDPNFPLDSNCTGANSSWWVPISMTDGSAMKFAAEDKLPVVWLTPQRPSVAIPGPEENYQWILLNLEYSGYYRVNYDRLNWELLSGQLVRNFTAIPPLNRAQLIDDVFVLGHANILPYDVALNLIEYLGQTNDEETYIRSVAAGHVNRIEQTIMLQSINNSDNRNETLEDIVKTMKTYIYPPSNSLNRDLIESDVDITCNTEEQSCVEDVLRLVRNFIDRSTTLTEEKIIKKNLEMVWCTALRHGGHSEWAYAWNNNRLSSTMHPSEKRKILKAMACSRDLTHIKQLLSRMFYPNIDQQPSDTLIILKSLAENPSAQRSTLNFVLRNWSHLNKHFQNDPSRVREVLLATTQYSSTTAELEKVSAFLNDKAKELGPGITDLIVATISNNLRKAGIQKIKFENESLKYSNRKRRNA